MDSNDSEYYSMKDEFWYIFFGTFSSHPFRELHILFYLK